MATPIADKLLSTDDRRRRYAGRSSRGTINIPWYHAVVEKVRAAELRGLDGVEVLIDALVRLDDEVARLSMEMAKEAGAGAHWRR